MKKVFFSFYKDGHDYEDDPRAIIYAKYNNSILTVEDMKKWLLTNSQESPKSGIAPRYDLAEQGAAAFGLTDCKIVAPETQRKNYIWAISGPTTSGGKFPPFSWSNWPKVPHNGMPMTWNFDWVQFPIDNDEVMLQV